MGERVAGSRRRHAEALQMGGEQAANRHRASGRLPVRERVALSGPSVVEAAIGEQLTDAELGGPDGAQAAGNAHMVEETDQDPDPLGGTGPRAGRQAGRGGGPRVPGTAVGQPRKDTFADLAAEHRGPGRDRTEDQL
jgi:hypothetical protein